MFGLALAAAVSILRMPLHSTHWQGPRRIREDPIILKELLSSLTARMFTCADSTQCSVGHTMVTDSGSRTPRMSEDDTADKHEQPVNSLAGLLSGGK